MWSVPILLDVNKKASHIRDSRQAIILDPIHLLIMIFTILLAALAAGGAQASATPEYHTLPPLREQAKIRDGWTRERRDAIPSLLQKHGVDAWLVRSPRTSPFPTPN